MQESSTIMGIPSDTFHRITSQLVQMESQKMGLSGVPAEQISSVIGNGCKALPLIITGLGNYTIVKPAQKAFDLAAPWVAFAGIGLLVAHSKGWIVSPHFFREKNKQMVNSIEKEIDVSDTVSSAAIVYLHQQNVRQQKMITTLLSRAQFHTDKQLSKLNKMNNIVVQGLTKKYPTTKLKATIAEYNALLTSGETAAANIENLMKKLDPEAFEAIVLQLSSRLSNAENGIIKLNDKFSNLEAEQQSMHETAREMNQALQLVLQQLSNNVQSSSSISTSNQPE